MRKRLAAVLLAVMVAPVIAGCSDPGSSYVKADDVALGRVVVYRNGVAFYERRATVIGGALTVSVPRDRVDDFLKSLTVVDAKTKQPLPVTIPRTQSADGPFLTMKLQLPSTAPADVVLTYVTESPAWKPSYRVVVGDKGKVQLEGWAIVDNTSGEDWKNVIIGVGSSSALSFRYDLWSVRQVQREQLSAEERFAVAPPTGVSPYGGRKSEAEKDGDKQKQDGTVVAELDETDLKAPVDAPAKMPMPAKMDKTAAFARGDDQAPAAAASPTTPANGPANDDAKIAMLSKELAKSGEDIVVEGDADATRDGAQQRAAEQANNVRNQLIDRGVAPARIKISTKVAAGMHDHIRLVAQQDAQTETGGTQPGKPAAPDSDASPVGESHFASTMPMTVDKGSSVMVSMVKDQTDGEVVYLYDAESERGNDKFAFRAVRFRNPTDSTLETGPVTVYGSERFIGEGLTEPIPPKASAVVPYALDRQVVVERTTSEDDKLSRLETVQRGVLTAEVQHIKREQLTLTNRLREPAKVYIRHTVGKGWNLIDSPKAFERIGDAHLFEVELAPLETKQVAIAESTPIERTLDLTADATMGMMKVYIDAPDATPALKAQLVGLLDIHKKLDDLAEEQDSLRQRLEDYRERMNELHDQIFSLTAVRTGGELMGHLKDKMRDMSDRVSKTTIAIVDNEEKSMLTRVRFKDALSELTLGDASVSGKLAVTEPAPAR